MKPFAHQTEVLEHSKDFEAYALFWEQGTGKTKPTLDNAAYLAKKGEIDALLVLAPNEVPRNWVDDEIPKHLGRNIAAATYVSSKAGTIKHRKMLHDTMAAPFCVVTMGYDAFMTIKGTKFAQLFFKKRKVMMVLDESHAIKSPGAKRTKRIIAAGKHAKYRRILTGTPIANSPFDIYSPVRFLEPTFWKERGFGFFSEFKHYFGIFRQGVNKQQGKERTYEYVVGYKNLEELKEMIAPISSRVLKDDVLDLPPKLYSKRYFELSKEQQRVYKELRDEALTFLSTGDLVAAPLAIVRLLRLHQVTCNYLPHEEGEPLIAINDTNPRLECLRILLEEVGTTQAIIWARFREDINQIIGLLKDKAVRYDGQTSSDDRAKAKSAFQSGDVQFFVGNPAAAGTGLTLHAARTVIYYNNSFRLVERLQSEDRAHRIGQEHPVNYVDIMAQGTIDTYIVRALRNKVNIAAAITGDELKEWI